MGECSLTVRIRVGGPAELKKQEVEHQEDRRYDEHPRDQDLSCTRSLIRTTFAKLTHI
jgi:hypothetical protein